MTTGDNRRKSMSTPDLAMVLAKRESVPYADARRSMRPRSKTVSHQTTQDARHRDAMKLGYLLEAKSPLS